MKLTIVGQGIRAFEQITLEGLAALQSCKKVLYLSVNGDDENLEFLRKWNIQNFENIKALYEDSALDQENYQRLLDKVIEETQKEENVSLLIPGHPRVGVTLVKWLENQKAKLNLDLIVLPGISSFDTMINDLGLDPLEHGAQMLDTNRVLLFDYQLETCLDTFLYHVCSVGVSHTHLSNASQNNAIDLLQSHLEKFYPASHTVYLLTSNIDVNGSATSVSFPLKELTEQLPKIHFGSTLYIPALRAKKINKSFLQLLRA